MVLAVIVGVCLGSIGIFSLAMMVWLSHRRFGVDQSAKHGISVSDTSRLGGLAILTLMCIFWLLSYFEGSGHVNLGLIVLLTELPSYTIPVLAIGLLGLADDLGVEIEPSIRLLAMIFVALTGFAIMMEWLPNKMLQQLGIEYVWARGVLLVLSSILLVGFVNAANMSDGANGLLSGICLAFFWVSWDLQNDGLSYYLIVALLCFWLINLFTGRIMLGDLGAYSLGALVVFTAFELFDEHGVHPFFLASILSYPCFELLRALITRVLSGQSPLSADNSHLHNEINYVLGKLLKGNTLPNSLTGLTLAIISCLPSFFVYEAGLYGQMPVNFFVFGVQVISFIGIWWALRRNRRSN